MHLKKLKFYFLKGEPGLLGARGLPVSNAHSMLRDF